MTLARNVFMLNVRIVTQNLSYVRPIPSADNNELFLGMERKSQIVKFHLEVYNPVSKGMEMLQIQNGFFQGAQDSLHCYRFYFCL